MARSKKIERCAWCGEDPLYVNYHDSEWGVPLYDSRALFEKLILDGFQAGLSWITILRKRNNFIKAFDNFDPKVIATYQKRELSILLKDEGIVRNRQKIEGTVINARLYLELEAEGSFSEFLWDFVGGKPIQNSWKTLKELPAQTPESEAMSKALRKRGFKFVGPTICYAFMQAVGMVNDHVVGCFRYREIKGRRRARHRG